MNEAALADARQLQYVLRFASAVTAAFLLAEFMGWWPSFIAAALVCALLGNLPVRPTPKMAVGLIVVMTLAALLGFLLSATLRTTPFFLFSLAALVMFLLFYRMLTGGSKLPTLLMLICTAIVPVVMIAAPPLGGVLPKELVRGMVVALFVISLIYIPWPLAPPPPKAAPPPTEENPAGPVVVALLATAVVVPLMLVFLLYSLSSALPVLVATVLLVVNFDPRRGRRHAVSLVMGNMIGGMLGMVLHSLLLVAPSLLTLGLLLFPTLLAFGRRIARGGQDAAVGVVACNAMLIILSSAISSGSGSLTLWLTRLSLFGLAGVFAVGMMNLVWYLPTRQPARSPAHGPG